MEYFFPPTLSLYGVWTHALRQLCRSPLQRTYRLLRTIHGDDIRKQMHPWYLRGLQSVRIYYRAPRYFNFLFPFFLELVDLCQYQTQIALCGRECMVSTWKTSTRTCWRECKRILKPSEPRTPRRNYDKYLLHKKTITYILCGCFLGLWWMKRVFKRPPQWAIKVGQHTSSLAYVQNSEISGKTELEPTYMSFYDELVRNLSFRPVFEVVWIEPQLGSKLGKKLLPVGSIAPIISGLNLLLEFREGAHQRCPHRMHPSALQHCRCLERGDI